MKIKTGYFPSIDLLRGLAAISVCLYHFFDNENLHFHTILNDIFKYGHLGVQVFFVISGFVIPYSMYVGNFSISEIKVFFLKRISRLEPPYIISILLVLGLNYVSTLSPYYHGKPFEIDLLGLTFHIGYLNTIFQKEWLNPVYWTLAIEFQYYILVALIFVLINNKTAIWYMTFAAMLVLSLTIPFNPYIFKHLPYFIIGIATYRYLTDKDSLTSYIIQLSLTLLFIAYQNKEVAFLIAAIIPLPFFLFFKISSGIGRFLGNISYSIYLIHGPLGNRIINLGVNFTKSTFSELVLILGAIVLTIAFSYVFYLLIEKPSKKLSKRFVYKSEKRVTNTDTDPGNIVV